MFTCTDYKTAEQFTQYHTIGANPTNALEHLYSVGSILFASPTGIRIEEHIFYGHNLGSTCSQSKTRLRGRPIDARLARQPA
jgi:hypothetical protein